MPAGRPTKYNKDILAKSREYLTNYSDLGDPVPTIAGLACELNVSRGTLYDWAAEEEKEEFSDILEAIMAKQERVLAGKGLTGDFNPNITKMMLTKHGYSDKQDVNLGGQKDNPVDMKWTVEVVDAKSTNT
ncbi:MAG: DNA-packaging protein [Candidatus Thorarchaeota archaeon]|jgi:hypothetical protein